MSHRLKVVFSIVYFGILVFVDQLSKYYAAYGKLNFTGTYFNIEFQRNYGFALGVGEHDHQLLNLMIGFSFSFLFVAVFWFMFYFFKNYKLPLLKISLLHLLAGAGGNVLDKILRGYAIDFLQIKVFFFQDLHINLADILLIIGILGVILEIFRKSSLIWYDANKRKVVLIDPSFQKFESYLFVSVIWTISFVFYVGFLGLIVYFKVPRKHEIIWFSFIIQFFLTLILSFTAYFFALLHSHRTSGALFSFKKFLSEISSGSTSELEWKSRESDFHQEILKSCSKDIINLVNKSEKR
jgi:signal peptidase II